MKLQEFVSILHTALRTIKVVLWDLIQKASPVQSLRSDSSDAIGEAKYVQWDDWMDKRF
jgi:hypothetical protein